MTGSTATAVAGAFAAACITLPAHPYEPPSPLPPTCYFMCPSASGLGAAAAGTNAINARDSRFELGRRRNRDRALLGRLDVLLAHIPHQDPAASGLIGPDLPQRGLLHLAPVDGERAARVELAPGRRVREVR